MLDSTYSYDNTGFNLKLKTDPNWKTSKMRVLIVVEHILTPDLQNHELMSTDDTHAPMVNVIKYALREVKKYGKAITPAFRVFNFRSEKHLHLSNDQIVAKEKEFGVRTVEAIEKMKPTHVLFCGPAAYTNCVPCAYPMNRVGWVERNKFGTHECYTTFTFDLYRLLEKDGAAANNLGSLIYHLSYLLNSEFPFDLSYVKPHPVYVDTKEKFDSLMTLLEKSKFVGLDTETRNLTVNDNAIYTIQFSSDLNDKGYVLVLDHPQTPWTAKQIRYFKVKLKKFFSTSDGPTLVTMNGMFDLRVIRRALRLPIIRKRVWEITAGEHLLNETLDSWRNHFNGTSFGNLRAILCSYQNDFYYRAKFTKEDRGTTGDTRPDDPDFLKYAAMDVCCMIPIMKMQCKRASYMDIAGKNYEPLFKRHMLYEMSDTAHVISHLNEFGSYIDMKYMKLLASKNSPFVQELNEIKSDIFAHPATQQANKELLGQAGFKSKGLFASKKNDKWVFNLGKADHRVKLFLDVLGLKSVEKTMTGAPSIGKVFIKEYKDSNEVVELYAKYQEVNKIYTSYIKGWYKLLTTDSDGSYDAHLRPSYGFFGVDTGRLSSRNPSLQVIPQHSKSAKILKRAFVAPPGFILVRYDYSAHEVRGWAIVSGDDHLADAFRAGQKLRQEWIKNPTDEVLKRMKTEGDIHIQNAHRFFGKWVDKKDPLRQAVKSVVFGVLYGKGPATLGNDTKTAEVGEMRSTLNEKYHEYLKDESNSKLRKEIAELKKKIKEVQEEDRSEYAQNIMDKMFSTYKNGHRWTVRMTECAKKNGYVYSPLGRVRHLMSTVLINPKDKKLIGRQVRRGSNAPIQGFASEIAVKASRITLETYYDELPKLIEMMGLDTTEWKMKVESSRMVHDASYYAVPYDMVLPFIQITQYTATYGIAKALKEQFNLTCNIEPEVEFETAVRDDMGATWSWDIPNLLQNLMTNVDQGVELGIIEDGDEVKRRILAPWLSKKVVKYLDEKYPLLNVHLAKKIYDCAKQCEQNIGRS